MQRMSEMKMLKLLLSLFLMTIFLVQTAHANEETDLALKKGFTLNGITVEISTMEDFANAFLQKQFQEMTLNCFVGSGVRLVAIPGERGNKMFVSALLLDSGISNCTRSSKISKDISFSNGVKLGLSESDVEKILGKPPTVNGGSNIGKCSLPFRACSWQYEFKQELKQTTQILRVQLAFVSGKVSDVTVSQTTTLSNEILNKKSISQIGGFTLKNIFLEETNFKSVENIMGKTDWEQYCMDCGNRLTSCYFGKNHIKLEFNTSSDSSGVIRSILLRKSDRKGTKNCSASSLISEKLKFDNGIGVGIKKSDLLRKLGRPDFTIRNGIKFRKSQIFGLKVQILEVDIAFDSKDLATGIYTAQYTHDLFGVHVGSLLPKWYMNQDLE